MFVASTYSKKEIFTDIDPDLIIFHTNELVTMNTKYGAPRIGEDMSELEIINDGAVAVKDDIIIFIGFGVATSKTSPKPTRSSPEGQK